MTVLLDRAWSRVADAAAGEANGALHGAEQSLGAAAIGRLRLARKGSGSKIREWRQVARPEQVPPDDPEWLYWLICAGRGFGKSYSGSHTLAEWAAEEPGDYAAVGPTFGDARKIMTEGPSGLLVALGDELRDYNKSDFILYLRNGSRIILASADAPERLRGWNLSGCWLDELASMRDSRDLWDLSLLPALRIGDKPRAVITTTPRRGSAVLVELLDRAADDDPLVKVTRGSTLDNRENLSEAFIQAIYARYGNSALGAQELGGELLQDAEGALVSSELIEQWRVTPEEVPEDLYKVAVGVDPAVTNTSNSDETGIVAVATGPAPAGWRAPGDNAYQSNLPHVYVLQDATLKASPETWARRALAVVDTWAAEVIAAEVNNGGDLVTANVRSTARFSGQPVPQIHQVRASRGKVARAEPLVPLFEQGRIHFVGRHAKIETDWTGWVPGETERSPDRLDAMCWAVVELMPEYGLRPPTVVRVIA